VRASTETAEQEKAEKSCKSIRSTRLLSAFVKSICDVMRRANCASARSGSGIAPDPVVRLRENPS
jgi:hypothetical protein